MPTLDYARGPRRRDGSRRDGPRRDEPYTPVYEPGPIRRALAAAWDVLDFWVYSPIVWLARLLWIVCQAATAWLR